jgi:hypothetical protein
VLIGDAKGKPRFDFTGRLARSWPAMPDQATLNRGDASPAPLFAYGFGASYARPARVGVLSEEGGCSPPPRADRPLVIDTTGRLRFVMREVRLSTNEGDVVCP